jgi:adenosylmethionine-8-amino-7-oxononanoate aminotransferase
MPQHFNLSSEELIAFDQQHIWHPYTSIEHGLPVYHVASAKDVYLTLANGKKLVDGMSSWWTAIHGYNHPVLNAAVQHQLGKMAHVMFGGLTHDPAVELASLLVDITPHGLEKVFYCDSGSVAVEVSIKMAQQYWSALNKPKKKQLLTIRSGYHGDTFKAMSVCDPDNGMHALFNGAFPTQFFADAPKTAFNEEWNDTDMTSIRTLIMKHHEELAAVILEPIVQGAGAMWFYSAEFLTQLRSLCNEYQLLLIADEVATGFGRTGKLFAVEHAGIVPDIMCVGKALTGGYLGMAAVLTTTNVSKTISQGHPGVLMHGPTYMANPLSCAVAVASTKLLLDSPWEERIRRIEMQFKEELNGLSLLPTVKAVRVLGAIGVVEMKAEVDVAGFMKKAVEEGVWIRPFRNLIYIMPPYISNEEEVNRLTRCIVKLLKTT